MILLLLMFCVLLVGLHSDCYLFDVLCVICGFCVTSESVIVYLMFCLSLVDLLGDCYLFDVLCFNCGVLCGKFSVSLVSLCGDCYLFHVLFHLWVLHD